MLIKGTIIESETKKPIKAAKVRVFKGQDDTTRYQTMTKDDGTFVLVVPDNFPIQEASGQSTLQFLTTHWEYNPVEMTITTLPGRKDINDGFEVWMQPWGGRVSGQTKAYTSIALLTLLLIAISLLYARVNFLAGTTEIRTSQVMTRTVTTISALQKKLNQFPTDAHLPNDAKAVITEISGAADETLRSLSNLEKALEGSWLERLSNVYRQRRYWWNIIFWSMAGALVGFLWNNMRSIVDENFRPKYLSSIPYRILGAPFYAIAFIFFARVVGFAADVVAGLDLTKALPQPTPWSSGIAMGVAFLAGLFIERVHERLRSLADGIFPSGYLGGKAPSQPQQPSTQPQQASTQPRT
jgi:hypothetical protein